MALQLKQGVSVKGVQPETVLAMCVVDGVYEHIGVLETVITSVIDGKHGENSLHDSGHAFDHRLPSRSGSSMQYDAIATHLIREHLGPEYDVVLENDHIHTEYDPKEK